MNKEKKQNFDAHDPRYVIELAQNHMNTTFTLEASVKEAEMDLADEILLASHHYLTELENQISEFKDQSDLSNLKYAAPHTPIPVSAETIALCEMSRQISIWSAGSFNPSFRSKNGLKFEENFYWDSSQNTLSKTSSKSLLGFGAIGKGFALDQISKKLLNAGIKNFRLNAGGSSIILSGSESFNVPWQIGFSWVKEKDTYLGEYLTALSSPLYIGVSGTLEQGQHIILNSLNQLNSAFVTAASAAEADAISTAIFANPDLAKKHVDGSVLLVDNKGKIMNNSVFHQQFKWSKT